MNSFVECADGNASGGREYGRRDVLPAKPRTARCNLVVSDFEQWHCRLPVGCNLADHRVSGHDLSGRIGQRMEYCRIRSGEQGFNRIFFVHDVVAFQFQVGVRITLFERCLDIVHILFQGFRGLETDNQFAVGE